MVPGRQRRARFVARYVLPGALGKVLVDRYPLLSPSAIGPAKVGMRQWLRLHSATHRLLGMPSRAVDLLWHEFILDTVEYSHFCHRAYGRFLHHRPAAIMAAQSAEETSRAMALTYAMACRDEGRRAHSLKTLPALFAADTDLGIADGQLWILNCGGTTCRAAETEHCVRHALIPLIPAKLPKQARVVAGGQLIHSDSYGTEWGTAGGSCGGGSCGGH